MPNDLATAALSGTPAAGSPAAGTPASGTPAVGTPAAGTPAVGAPAFTWAPDLAPEVTDLLQKKAFDKDPNALAKSYFEINKLVSSGSVITLPTDGNFDPVYDKMGRPKTADEYTFKFKDGVTPDPDFEKFGKSFFHKLGVPAGKTQEALDMWQDYVIARTGKSVTDGQAANLKELADLETNMGGKEKFGAYVAKGQAAYKALGLPAAVMSKIEASIGSAAMMQLVCTMGMKMGGEAAVLGTGPSGGTLDPNQMTLAQLDAEMKTLEADVEFMKGYNEKAHPKHDENVKKMLGLEDLRVKRRRGL